MKSIDYVAKSLIFYYNQRFLLMSKEATYILMQNVYPFSQTRQAIKSGHSIQVKKVIEYDSQPRFIIKEKIRMLKNLGFQYLIGLQSTISEQNAIILFFQCIPYQFLKETSVLNEQKITNIYNEMLQLCESLASRFIIHDLDVNRVGFDKRFNLKYFLGVDFKIDKNIDKNKKNESYVNQVNDFFLKVCSKTIKFKNRVENGNHQNSEKLPSFLRISKNESKFQINVQKILNFDPKCQRRILKKSSILDSKQDQLKALKASNRFTFNNDNRIVLPIHQQPDDIHQKQSTHHPLKMQELSLRINKLKNYMKEVTGKMQRNNVSPIHMDKYDAKEKNLPPKFLKRQQESNSHSPQHSKKLTPSKFSQIQKKLAQLRISKLTLPSHNVQNQRKIDNQPSDLKQRCNQAIIVQIPKQTLNEYPTNIEQISLKPLESSVHPVTILDLSKKNVLNILDEDRQHKQYLLLANKDKYCEQFMNFLEDNDPSLKSSAQESKIDDNIRVSSPFLQPQGSPRKRNVLLRQNLKTQSSENALQIQNRVQKVIRSSLKLINGLRSRQTIKCQ